jgi:hypothetical protein
MAMRFTYAIKFVDDMDAALAFTQPTEVVHGTRIARLRDADGAEISVSGL